MDFRGKHAKGDRVKTANGRGPGTVVKVDPHNAYVQFDGENFKSRFAHSDLVPHKDERRRGGEEKTQKSEPRVVALARGLERLANLRNVTPSNKDVR